ncbi:MAG: enoyl-CoA hydratase/isomerase family protein [Candidatus Rokubacteria bacterium]|nr:enoyl-CoA hydratase/isomerase family protein [Candidatus Rokubacteria bacterium]
MTQTNEILYDKRGRAAWLTINRAERRNAMNAGVIAGIADGLRQAASDPEVRVVVLTGVGDKAFCAGADLSVGTGTFGRDFSQPTLPFADLLRQAHNLNLPTVARVNGACMAGGMGLMGMCDLAVAADHAVFGLPEVKIGVFPMQVLSVLQLLLKPRDLYEMCMSGEPVDAATARDIGLVNYTVPAAELDAKVDWLLNRIVDKSPTAIRRGKYAMRAIAGMTFGQAIAFTEGQIGLAAMTEDAREGVAAFNEKRKPEWPGR